MKTYPESKPLNLPQIADEILKFWEENRIFEKSVSSREGSETFVFYEGPPSANGLPGIHHAMGRTIKDLFCRYQTLKGKQVLRKAGWDTHGLPIELSVEKTLGITKEDIGRKISVEEYNLACRKEVLKYTDKWEELTRLMGYWVDTSDPYITYENKYIESVWWLLKQLYDKKLLYKGYSIQPYSPAAGTGLSTHELNQPGCYRNVRDTTAVAMFKIIDSGQLTIDNLHSEVYFLAWTTTPWTLPSNTALAVGPKISYVAIQTYDPYSHLPVVVIMAKDLSGKYFPEKNAELSFEEYKKGDKNIPFKIVKEFKGNDLVGTHYEQLLPFVKPMDGEAFRVIPGDFVTTEDGTGIVHIAPSFGADDFRVAKQNGIGSLTLVDKRGRFLDEVKDEVFLYGGEFVKEDYLSASEKQTEFEKQKKILEKKGKVKELKEYLNVDERIVLKLQEEGKLFKKEKYEHTYPHCWRTDKPVLYYPLDSWFVKVTAGKDRMVELNKTIHWKPEHTGTGRFGEWLNNLQDWNLSRSRFWGIPLPIWRTEDGTEELIIGSLEELSAEIKKSAAAGFMSEEEIKSGKWDSLMNAKNTASERSIFDLHKPFIDRVILCSASGKKMMRESDLIDVWFDSGSMPSAQWHYPFENKEAFQKNFPADFIAEGVDQTRGWFYTLHAIATLVFDSIAYKNVVSNGLVLDKQGNKMSKRLGNTIDPFETLKKYGPDAVRWYMVTNSDPWDNLKFDLEGIAEKQRTFFGTLHNTFAFFSLYANIDKFSYKEAEIPFNERPEIDRWILSELNSLIKAVDGFYSDYEPTKAGRAIEYFVDEHLSNWYVRLCRRRFWKGDYSKDKIAAYQTLYYCLEVIAQLASPVAPFFSERLFKDMNDVTGRIGVESIHLSKFPVADELCIDKALEERMELAQKISSMVLSIRKKENIRVRQPLGIVRIPVLDESFKQKLEGVKDLILSEVNVKTMEFAGENETKIVKNLKLNFKTLGKKSGKHMKAVQAFALDHSAEIISALEKQGRYELKIENDLIEILSEDAEIIPVDIPGWKVANDGPLTVALDIMISPELQEEGIARELINRIQNLRKEKKLEVTDRILLEVGEHEKINSAVFKNKEYICTETLADSLVIVKSPDVSNAVPIEITDGVSILITLKKSGHESN